MKYQGWFIETNGKEFRPYRIVKKIKGIFKKKVVKEKDYIWIYAGWGYDAALYKPAIYKTIDEAKKGIEEENFKNNRSHDWKDL